MDTDLIIYKYQSDSKGGFYYQSVMAHIMVLTFVLGLLAYLFYLHIAFGVIASIIVLVIRFKSRFDNIIVGPDFIVVGDQTIFYDSISALEINTSAMICKMIGGKKEIKICGDKFPTNARKDFKIKANRKKKFEKLVSKLKERLENSSVEIKNIK